MRGTFANVRLRNQLAPGTEGGLTVKDGEETSIYDAADGATPTRACRCACSPARSTARGRRATGPPRGRACSACGSCSPSPTSASTARTWWGWACCRCSSPTASRSESLGLTGLEGFDLDAARGRRAHAAGDRHARRRRAVAFEARVRIDTPNEWQYFRGGGHPPLRAPPAACARIAASATTTSASAAARRTCSACSWS